MAARSLSSEAGVPLGGIVVAGGVAVSQKPQRPAPTEPKKRGRDWGFLLFIAGILLVAIGTQVSILIPVGIACIVVVIVGILVRMFKQLYF
jgi:hypothetical protein